MPPFVSVSKLHYFEFETNGYDIENSTFINRGDTDEHSKR